MRITNFTHDITLYLIKTTILRINWKLLEDILTCMFLGKNDK